MLTQLELFACNFHSEIEKRIMKNSNLQTKLAAYAHKSWSGWTSHLFSKCDKNPDGTLTIPKWAVERWQRQIDTTYEELTAEEQKSDLHEANLMIEVVDGVRLEGMSFGGAIAALKQGHKVARKGWNGKGMWLILVEGQKEVSLREGSTYRTALNQEKCELLPHIDMWTVNAEGRRAMLCGWVASQTDILYEDWCIVEDK